MNIEARIGRGMILVAVSGAALAACTPNDTTFGGAVKQNFAAQVIEPEPQYEEPLGEMNGDKAAAAIERYRTDKVKRPRSIRTTSAISGGGAGGTGGSGGSPN